MEQCVSTLLICHHQAKHVLYNTQMEYIKCLFLELRAQFY